MKLSIISIVFISLVLSAKAANEYLVEEFGWVENGAGFEFLPYNWSASGPAGATYSFSPYSITDGVVTNQLYGSSGVLSASLQTVSSTGSGSTVHFVGDTARYSTTTLNLEGPELTSFLSVDDTLTISNPALNGTKGTFSFAASFYSSLRAELNCDTSAPIWVDSLLNSAIAVFPQIIVESTTRQMLTPTYCYARERVDADLYSGDRPRVFVGSEDTGLFEPGSVFSAEFVFGQPFRLNLNLFSEFWLYTPGNISGALSFDSGAGSYLYWNGIKGVTDAAGNPVANFDLTSFSGADYRKDFQSAGGAVPEPATYGLIGALGLLIFVGVRRFGCGR